MIPATALRHTIQNALARRLPGPAGTAEPAAPCAPNRTDLPRDPDWALREIVDDKFFETIR